MTASGISPSAVETFAAREREFRVTDELVDRIASRPEDFGVAANDDPNKALEAETPRD